MPVCVMANNAQWPIEREKKEKEIAIKAKK